MPDAPTRTLLEQQAIDYRNRAEEYRTVGEASRTAEVRHLLRELADNADRMASKLEHLLRHPPAAAAGC